MRDQRMPDVVATFNASRRRRLGGYVEVDETMWGSSQKGLHSKPSRCKGAFWAAWERGSGDFIIEQMDWMPSFYKMKGAAPANAVLPLVEKWVLPKTTIFTDGLRAYLKLPKLKDKNYVHYHVCHDKGEWVGPEVTSGQRVHTQSVDGMWGHLKTWLRTRRGVHKSTLAGYVACFEWRSRTKEDSRFTALMSGVVQHWNVTTNLYIYIYIYIYTYIHIYIYIYTYMHTITAEKHVVFFIFFLYMFLRLVRSWRCTLFPPHLDPPPEGGVSQQVAVLALPQPVDPQAAQVHTAVPRHVGGGGLGVRGGGGGRPVENVQIIVEGHVGVEVLLLRAIHTKKACRGGGPGGRGGAGRRGLFSAAPPRAGWLAGPSKQSG